MATFLELVNKVLVKLREDEVSTYNQTEYSALVATFINEAKRDVENSHKWTILRNTDTFNVTSGTASYPYSDLKDNSGIISVYDNTQQIFIEQTSLILARLNSNVTGPAQGWYLKGNSSGIPLFVTYPTPSSSYTLYVDVYTPQDELSDDDTTLIVPWFPVYMGAYFKALMERGDDGGESAANALQEYMKSLNDSISFDAKNLSDEFIWHVN